MAKRKPKSGGFDQWQPDLWGGAGKERGEGRTRAEQMKLARDEMRDTGSRSMFEHERKENPMLNPGKMRRTRRARTAAFQSRMFLWDRGKPRAEPAEDARRRRQRHRERGNEARAYRADRDEGMAPFFNPRRRRRNPSGRSLAPWVIGGLALLALVQRSRQVG